MEGEIDVWDLCGWYIPQAVMILVLLYDGYGIFIEKTVTSWMVLIKKNVKLFNQDINNAKSSSQVEAKWDRTWNQARLNNPADFSKYQVGRWRPPGSP